MISRMGLRQDENCLSAAPRTDVALWQVPRQLAIRVANQRIQFILVPIIHPVRHRFPSTRPLQLNCV
jgi:hypothetical protein